MSFSPFARFRNFTVANLKSFLDTYPDMASKMSWNDAIKAVDAAWPGYKKTAYQQACQMGLEDRSEDEFRVHNYLYEFDDDNLKKYLEFWIKVYYAPNPYVNSTDTPRLLFCEIAEEILLSPTLELDYDNYFATKIGGGSDDILLNAIKEFGAPIKYKKNAAAPINVLFVDKKDELILTTLVNEIKRDFPIGSPMDRKEFFERFSFENFKKFYHISSRVALSIPCVNYESGFTCDFDRNRIVFGAPGTGKSYRINKDKTELLKSDSDFERVTFHPDYTYSQFVGTYKPVSLSDGSISYKFVPGPFMRLYAKAIKNIISATDSAGNVDVTKIKPFVLIVEEINRAKASAVFGDLFQLLDRNDKHVSEYGIQATEEIKEYLCDEIGGQPADYSEIMLPDNLFIWSTMNSADQGVFPMDTAFKRRWNFEYIGIDDEEVDSVTGVTNVPGKFKLPTGIKELEWNKLRKAINELLSSDDVKVNEDKLLGPFFINSKKYIVPGTIDELDKEFYKLVENKVLMYLYEDAAKTKKLRVFADNIDSNRFSALKKAFETRDLSIFKGINGKTFEDIYNSY